MRRKSKWYTMTAMLFGGGTLFQLGGCGSGFGGGLGGGLGGFWNGFFNGWPGDPWLNLAIDVLNEELFG